jgi:hypothetical protein
LAVCEWDPTAVTTVTMIGTIIGVMAVTLAIAAQSLSAETTDLFVAFDVAIK